MSDIKERAESAALHYETCGNPYAEDYFDEGFDACARFYEEWKVKPLEDAATEIIGLVDRDGGNPDDRPKIIEWTQVFYVLRQALQNSKPEEKG